MSSVSQDSLAGRKDDEKALDGALVDEATLIEERRKRREAIKAKYKGQSTPLLVKALAINHEAPLAVAKGEATNGTPSALGQTLFFLEDECYADE